MTTENRPSGEGMELYSSEEKNAVEAYIRERFGESELLSEDVAFEDIQVNIRVVPPSPERDRYLVTTVGMGAHVMTAPENRGEDQPRRVELVMELPGDWNPRAMPVVEEEQYWPVRLLIRLARLPLQTETWLGAEQTVSLPGPVAENTNLGACVLCDLQEGPADCPLPGGERVRFLQVVPIYPEEAKLRVEKGIQAFRRRLASLNRVVLAERPSFASYETALFVLDDARRDRVALAVKRLPLDDLCAYTPLAFWLRWCLDRGLVRREFLEEYGPELRAEGTDLRAFLRDRLNGTLLSRYFTPEGAEFGETYLCEGVPDLREDMKDCAWTYFGEERMRSGEFQGVPQLFLPFTDEVYGLLAPVMDRRRKGCRDLEINRSTIHPSACARHLRDYMGCRCTYMPSMSSDEPVLAQLQYAARRGKLEGFVPVIVPADETLWEWLRDTADPDVRAAGPAGPYAFDQSRVDAFRRELLRAPLEDGEEVLAALLEERREEAEADGLDWENEIVGKEESGYCNDRLNSLWFTDGGMTRPLMVAEIPVKHPWEIFAWLPMGGWNECPEPQQMMAVAKYWYEQYGAVPVCLTHDELEFVVPAPVPGERALDLALEMYGFCPDLTEELADAGLRAVADTLRQSRIWYFWWD